jgi:serine/threonine-protein kinase
MAASPQTHPSLEQLRGFAQGRLPPNETAELEIHVASCEWCCRLLEQVPDDTLVHLAREAATAGFRSGQSSNQSRAIMPPGIPPQLVDHPRYRVLGLVGFGGMGAVYKAEHRLMERLVALKVVSPAYLQDSAAVERFRREVRAAAKLSHPNIVVAFDADQADDLHFFVMEFVEGLSLDRLVEQRGPLGVQQACQLIRQAALALAHIHERGMVHRDIKPQNIMVMRQGQVKVLDCGLARLVSDQIVEHASVGGAEERADATVAGMILGTPDYIAPEQIRDARTADIRSDIYSLGCTFYFALTGRPPFPEGSAVEKIQSHANTSPQPIQAVQPAVPAALAKIIERMMAKEPAARFQTPKEVALALASFSGVSGEAVVSVTPQVGNISSPDAETSVFSQPPVAPPIARSKQPKSWPPAPMPLVATLLGCGTALAIMILAWGYADKLFLDSGKQAQAAGSDANSATSQAAGPAQVQSGVLPRKVLMVIPHQGLWLRDYRDVKATLEQHGVAVVTASTSTELSTVVPGTLEGNAKPDILIDNAQHRDYGAIIFTGFRTDDFSTGGSAATVTGRLIDEFLKEGRFVTAICCGQRVLARRGLLEGKRVARSPFMDDTFGDPKAEFRPTPVERDGQIITGAADRDAEAFAGELIKALEERR